MMAGDDPLYNLKAVVQKTGVAEHTLRAWERRYGIPAPRRTPSGRRLYSLQDIETIRWLLARQAEGMTVGQAVALWRALTAAGKDPLKEYAPTIISTSPAGSSIGQLRSAWIAAVLSFNEAAAEQVVTEALALYPPETVSAEILRQGIAEIGDAWYRGETTVQQEHFASHLVARRVQAMTLATPPPSRPGRLLILCPPEEVHSLGLLFLTFFLRRAGWDTVLLGENLPLDNLDTTVRTVRPVMAISAAQQLPAVVGLQALAFALRDLGVSLAYGGWIFNRFPPLRERIPAHFLSERLENAPARVEILLARNPAPPSVPPISDEYRQALARYRAEELSLHARILSALGARPPDRQPPSWVPDYTFRHVQAALTLGDLSFADGYMEWLRGWRNPDAPPEMWLDDFLNIYSRQAARLLGNAGNILVDWLEEQRCASLSPVEQV